MDVICRAGAAAVRNIKHAIWHLTRKLPGFSMPDFRNTERLFQLLSQTAGRAGRAQNNGKVLIQTLNPRESVMHFAIRHDFAGFAEKELQDRRDALYPPFCKLVEVSFGSKDESLLREAVSRVESLCRAEKSLMVLGPVDAFVPVVQNVRWAKIYLKASELNVIPRNRGLRASK